MSRSTIHAHEYREMIVLLKQYREARGLTQAELAAKIGADQTFISKFETRERRLDLLETRRICAALDVPMSDFVREWESRLSQLPVAPHPRADDENDLFSQFPESDRDWTPTDWEKLTQWFIEQGLVTHKELAAVLLGSLNPPQVGTSVASKKTFQSQYPKRKTWQAVREWYYSQDGRCVDCGTRLGLQADHIEPKQDLGEAADRLENLALRCRRCNVVKRPSHANGGLTYLTAEAALMWLLFTLRPKTYDDYKAICRAYGMTMADIRFQEAWAMAKWLSRIGLYEIVDEPK